MQRIFFFPIAACIYWLSAPAHAQHQVYRCEKDGKVSYSHAPCLNAQKIDTTPTQGLNSLTGQRRPSAEVQRSENQRAFAEALYPITRMSPEAHAREARRYRLLPEDRVQCAALDLQLPALERAAQQLKPEAQANLLKARQSYYELHC